MGTFAMAMQPTVQVILKTMKVKISAARMLLKSEKHSKTMMGQSIISINAVIFSEYLYGSVILLFYK